MAFSLNKATILGNLGRDPEIRSTQQGKRIANLNVATSESWRDKNSGERREISEWHHVTIFNDRLVEIVEKHARKGDRIWLEGKIQTRKWTDNQGVERFSTEIIIGPYNGEIILLGPRANAGSSSSGRRSEAPRDPDDDYMSGNGNGGTARPSSGVGSDLDDEIPF